MTLKFDNFKAALIDLCIEHSVYLCPSLYDSLQVWDIRGPDFDPRTIVLDDETEEP